MANQVTNEMVRNNIWLVMIKFKSTILRVLLIKMTFQDFKGWFSDPQKGSPIFSNKNLIKTC